MAPPMHIIVTPCDRHKTRLPYSRTTDSSLINNRGFCTFSFLAPTRLSFFSLFREKPSKRRRERRELFSNRAAFSTKKNGGCKAEEANESKLLLVPFDRRLLLWDNQHPKLRILAQNGKSLNTSITKLTHHTAILTIPQVVHVPIKFLAAKAWMLALIALYHNFFLALDLALAITASFCMTS